MSRVCELTGKRPAVANNVSHSNRKTKRRQLPNLQSKSMYSEVLSRMVSLRLSTSAMRTVDKYGGIDAFMLGWKARKTEAFSNDAQKIRKAIRAKAASQSESNEAKAS